MKKTYWALTALCNRILYIITINRFCRKLFFGRNNPV